MNEIYIKIPYWLENKYQNKDLITLDELLSDYEELQDDYNKLEEQFEEFKQDVNDNYKFIDQAEAIGYSKDW